MPRFKDNRSIKRVFSSLHWAAFPGALRCGLVLFRQDNKGTRVFDAKRISVMIGLIPSSACERYAGTSSGNQPRTGSITQTIHVILYVCIITKNTSSHNDVFIKNPARWQPKAENDGTSHVMCDVAPQNRFQVGHLESIAHVFPADEKAHRQSPAVRPHQRIRPLHPCGASAI